MTRRQFIQSAAIATVAAPHIPAAIARATPVAQQLLYVDWCDIVWPKAIAEVSNYDFVGGPADCEAFKKMWNAGMERYYGKQ